MIKVLTRRLIARYFSKWVRIFYHFKIKYICWGCKEVAIILTIGKVGSSSVYYSLKNKLKIPVFHLHVFTDESIKQSKKEHLTSARKSIPLHLIVAEELKKTIRNKKISYKIITLTREPVARIVSSFFQNTEMYGKELENNNLEINETVAHEYLKKILSDESICSQEEIWFEKQLNKEFGIDVFKDNFDLSKGYHIYKTERVDLLLIRMEDLNTNFSKSTKKFFGYKNEFLLESTNVGENKFYKDAYTNAKQYIKLEKDQIEKIITSRFFQQFYFDKIDYIRDKWEETIDNGTIV